MKLIHYLILAAAALSLGACNSSSDSPSSGTYLDIVTLKSTDQQGSIMTFNEENDSPLITLSCSQAFSKEQVGKRIVVLYQPIGGLAHAESGAVNVIQAGSVFGSGSAPVPAVVDTLDNWYSDHISDLQAYRAGQYLNLGMHMPSNPSIQPKKFECYIDETTLDNDYPELHIVFKSNSSIDQQDVSYFGSYNISSIWNRRNIKGIKVCYNGLYGKSVTIEKESLIIKPIE
ncbi:MAG: hypothetical protein K2I39_07520 [Muribaculaceae bacterium]|nr:hypothetical protein [Muribaculaceae bacterium]